MSESKVDWTVLRGAIGVFAVCLLIGGALIAGSKYFRDEMNREYQSFQTQFRDVSRKYLAVDDEERIIVESLPRFEALYAKGILGSEHRLSWIEVLQDARDQIKLPELSYSIDSQTVYKPEFPLNSGAFEIRVSEMELSLGLLHEGDLFNVFKALDHHAEGLYTVSNCEANRTSQSDVEGTTRAKISAQCQLRWFTVELRGSRKLSL